MTEEVHCNADTFKIQLLVSDIQTDWDLFSRIQHDDMEAALMSDGNGQAGFIESAQAQTRGNEGAMKYMTALSQNSSTAVHNSLVHVISHAGTI